MIYNSLSREYSSCRTYQEGPLGGVAIRIIGIVERETQNRFIDPFCDELDYRYPGDGSDLAE
ncbi:hypothetical protein [Chlorobium ferrooxidans]|uniref:hypothetical protein n=1 Tax=Chlorobium ferrooxidans TaxID=84205 RepID=UPI0002D63746|nr:hypothetical protein [Chlorobium ferrooxidans]